MSKTTADETVTVRMPYGTAAKLRAATGQPFSRLVRWIALSLLSQYNEENRHTLSTEATDIGNRVQELLRQNTNPGKDENEQ